VHAQLQGAPRSVPADAPLDADLDAVLHADPAAGPLDLRVDEGALRGEQRDRELGVRLLAGGARLGELEVDVAVAGAVQVADLPFDPHVVGKGADEEAADVDGQLGNGPRVAPGLAADGVVEEGAVAHPPDGRRIGAVRVRDHGPGASHLASRDGSVSHGEHGG